MRIGVDLDETIMPLIVPMNNYYNKVNGTNHKFEDFKTYGFNDVWQIGIDETIKFITDYLFSEEYQKVQPIQYAVEAIKEIQKLDYVIMITARSPQFTEVTSKLVDKYFDIPEKFFLGPEDMKNWNLSKAQFCKEKSIDFMIDDSQTTILDCIQNGVGGILFGNYQWNQDYNLVRKHNWKEIVDYLNNPHILTNSR